MATKVKTGVIDSGAITSALITDASITADDLHTTLDLTGKTVTVATASASDNDTSVASTAYVTTAIANLADSAPSTLNTLNELAAALGDDANFSTTVTNSIATKLPLAGGTVTGVTTFTGGDGVVVQTASDTFLQLKTTGSGSNYIEFKDSGGSSGNIRYNHSTNILSVKTNGTDNRLVIDASGNVGIGTTSPDANLEVRTTQSMAFTSDTVDSITIGTSGTNKPCIKFDTADTTHTNRVWAIENGAGGRLNFFRNGLDVLKLNQDGSIEAAGNVGIGTTPSVHYTGYEALDIGNTLSLMSNNTSTNISTLTNNGYLNSNASNWVRKVQDESTMYEQVSGQHRFKSAGSDSAGSAITWLERMRIDSSGKVGIGTDNPTNAKVHIVGDSSYVGDYGYSTLVLEDSSGYAGLNLRNGNNNWLMRNAGNNNSLQIVSSSNASGPGTGTYTPRLVIMQAGNVGIGTDNPSDKLEVSGTGGTRLKVTNTDTNWAGLDLQAGGNQANYLFFRDESAERSRIMATDGGEISFQTGASPVQRLKISTNDIVMGTGTVNESAKIISSGGTTVIRAADSNHSIVLRGTQDASGNITGNTNTMGFYEYGGYEFYTKQGNSRVKSLDMPAGGKVFITTSAPRSKYFDVNGVAEISEAFTLNNGIQYDFDYTVGSEGGAGNSYFIIAGYNHFYNTSYGAHKVAFMSARTTNMATMIDLGDQTSTGGGAWEFSKPTATTLRIRKTAGTYTGGGYGFIKVFFRNI